MRFIVYETTSGKILRTGECHDDMLDAQARVVEAAIEGEADDVTQYVSGGIVTARPSPSLSDVKVTQIAILTAAYTMAIQQPVAYMSTTFQADTDSQTKVMAVL